LYYQEYIDIKRFSLRFIGRFTIRTILFICPHILTATIRMKVSTVLFQSHITVSDTVPKDVLDDSARRNIRIICLFRFMLDIRRTWVWKGSNLVLEIPLFWSSFTALLNILMRPW
jgi:hypothetical protein